MEISNCQTCIYKILLRTFMKSRCPKNKLGYQNMLGEGHNLVKSLEQGIKDYLNSRVSFPLIH